tara:strand:- start:1059 stop:2294 length:1236 start_codon:yes stop_codon:yes gene_type:complete
MQSKRKIAEFATIKHGYAFEGRYFSEMEGEHILLTPGNFHIDQKLYFGKNTKYYQGPIPTDYVLQNGDLLVVMTDLTKNMAILGNAVILESQKAVLHNQRIGLVTIQDDQIDKQYLCYILNSDLVRNTIKSSASGTTVRHTSPSKILDAKAWFPELPTQKKIAQILSTWDKAITTTEQLLVNSQQQKKALMQQLLTGKKRLLDENGVRFSGEWQVLPLGQLTNIFDGTHSTPKYVEDGVPFYSVEHLTANDFSKTKFISEEVFDKENKRVKLERGDILMTRIGDIGTAKHLDWDVRASFYVSLALVKASESFDSEYMTQYINSNIFRSELWKRTIHVAFPKKINLGEISNCLVAIPSLEEQQKISAVLSTADQEITALQQKLDALQQEKKALMQQLLTGKRRVNTAEKEIA